MATCFHRNHMHNGEGGRDPEESRVDYVLDRANTAGTLWLGLTLGCTQCHDHKFDPISQQDYYRLTAYFNSIDEDGKAGGGAKPFLKFRSPYAKRAVEEAEQLVKQTEATLEKVRSESQAAFSFAPQQMISRTSESFEPWRLAQPAAVRSTKSAESFVEADAIIRSGNGQLDQDDFYVTAPQHDLERNTGVRLEVFADPQHSDSKYSYAESGEFVLTNVKLQVRHQGSSDVDDINLVRATAGVDGEGNDKKYGKAVGTLDDDLRTGWTTRTKPVDPVQVVVFELEQPLALADAVRSVDPMPLEQLAAAIKASESDSNTPFAPADVEESLRRKLHDQFLHVVEDVLASAPFETVYNIRLNILVATSGFSLSIARAVYGSTIRVRNETTQRLCDRNNNLFSCQQLI